MDNGTQRTIPESQLGSLSDIYKALMESDTFFKVDYTALNSSGAGGGAFLGLNTQTNLLTVVTTGTGVESGVPHPQHIHGFDAKDGKLQASQSPTLAQDADGDGIVELAEGGTLYGPIQLALTDPAGGIVADFPNTENNTFVQTASYDLSKLDAGAMNTDGNGGKLSDILTAENLDQREIVLHGLTLSGDQGKGTEGEADGTEGYKAVLPIAVGELVRVDAEQARDDLSDGRLGISNDVVAFDIQGNAGAAYRIYEAVLDRTADQGGLSYYTNQLDDGTSLANIANNLLNSDEFTENSGNINELSDANYVDLLYQNILDREADEGGRGFYVNELEQGMERASIAVSFSESEEHQAILIGQYDGGILLNESVIA